MADIILERDIRTFAPPICSFLNVSSGTINWELAWFNCRETKNGQHFQLLKHLNITTA